MQNLSKCFNRKKQYAELIVPKNNEKTISEAATKQPNFKLLSKIRGVDPIDKKF